MNYFKFLFRYIFCIGLIVFFICCQSEKKQTYQKEAVENALKKADSIPISGLEALALSLPGPAEQDSFFAAYIPNIYARKGLDSLAAVLPIFEKLRGKEIFAQSIIFERKGLIHQFSGRFDSAEYYYGRSISIWENTQEYDQYAKAFNTRAVLYNFKGNLDQAMTDRFKAIEILQNALDKPDGLTAEKKEKLESTMIEIRAFFGGDSVRKKEYQKAVDILQAPTAYYLEKGNIRMAALCLTTAAVAYEELKDLPKAYESCRKSMDLLRPANVPSQLGISLNNYAKLLQVEEKWQEALDTLKVAKVIFEKLNNPVALGRINFNMGRSQARLGQIKEAEDNFQFAYTLNDQRKDYLLLLNVCNEMAQLQKRKGDFAAALKFQEKANVVSDSIMNGEKEKITKNLEIKYETREKEAQISTLKIEKRLSDQRNLLIAAFLLLLTAAGWWFMRNRHRREKILLEKDILSKQKDLLEVQVKERTLQLETANATKDRLFSIIGHDLRKPTIAFYDSSKIINYLLQKKDFTTLEKVGEQIEADAQSLSRLTENLLSWALTEKDAMPHHPETVDLMDLTEHTLRIFERRATTKNISIDLGVEHDLTAFVDANAYRTIIRNLVDNSLKYTPENGSISIMAKKMADKVQIQIRDTGLGMTEAQIAGLFLLNKDKSTQGTEGEKGTGLGMYLVHELTVMNQGQITVDSTVGEGTVFTIVLPHR